MIPLRSLERTAQARRIEEIRRMGRGGPGHSPGNALATRRMLASDEQLLPAFNGGVLPSLGVAPNRVAWMGFRRTDADRRGGVKVRCQGDPLPGQIRSALATATQIAQHNRLVRERNEQERQARFGQITEALGLDGSAL